MVKGLDVRPASGPRKFADVEYAVLDLVESTDAQLGRVVEGVDAVVHCAGSSLLTDEPEMVHNAVLYAAVRLMCLTKTAGCKAFVLTSSTNVVYNGNMNLNAIPADQPYETKHDCPLNAVLVKVEQLCLQAGDDPSDPNAAFFTLSNRFPRCYGANDGVFATYLIQEELSIFPSRVDVRVEMIYLRNMAHAQVCAVKTLLDSKSRHRACGKALTITQSEEGETSTTLDFWSQGRKIVGVKRPFVIVPAWIAIAGACVIEFAYFFFQGLVPPSVWWSFNRSFLKTILKDNTFLGRREAFKAIGYQPRYTNESAFEDIAMELKAEQEFQRQHGQTTAKLVHFDHDPKEDIDWEPSVWPHEPGLLRTIYLLHNGPGVKFHEVGIFFFCTILAYVFAFAAAAQNHFTQVQTIVAVMFAGWHVVGAVMSMTGTNKKWFHQGGRLGSFFFWMMMIDIVLSVQILGAFFTASPYFVWCTMLVLVLGLLFLLKVCPLAYQRSYSIILFLGVLVAQYFHVYPELQPGMDWAVTIMILKFFVCHGPRHEPYKY